MMNVHIYVKGSGLIYVEIHRPKAGSGWRLYRCISPASWNRLVYVMWQYATLGPAPHCFRLSGQPMSQEKSWSLYCWMECAK